MAPHLSLIAKKLSGEISRKEEDTLQEWLDASPQNELLFHRLEDVWKKAKYEPSVRGQEKTFEKIAIKLELDHKNLLPISRSQSGGFLNYWQRMAAALLLILSATVVVIWYVKEKKQEHPVENAYAAIISKSNPRGQKSMIALPDGSQVRLNAESYLEYSRDFTDSRKVTLVGEAFFEVVRDTLHPFVVTAGEVQVRVLGTSFNVQAFPFEEDMTVAVASGTVMVEKENNGTVGHKSQLRPHEMVKVNHKTGAFEEGSFNPDELLAWKDGILVFQKASFDEIVQKLERWYGVNFIVRRDGPITNGFTGRYDNPSLEVVLEGMSFSSDFTYTIEGDTVIIE